MEYAAALWTEGAEAVRFLADRGLRDETLEQHLLGYVHDPAPGHERYRGWIAIPYLSARGTVTQVRFRRLDDGKPKYRQPHGTPLSLYNVQDTDRDHVVIAEGEFDTLILKQCDMAAVGIPGAHAWKPHYRWLFRDTDLVSVATDPDEEGRKAADRIMADLAGINVESRLVEIPIGHDVNTLYLQKPQLLRELLSV